MGDVMSIPSAALGSKKIPGNIWGYVEVLVAVNEQTPLPRRGVENTTRTTTAKRASHCDTTASILVAKNSRTRFSKLDFKDQIRLAVFQKLDLVSFVERPDLVY